MEQLLKTAKDLLLEFARKQKETNYTITAKWAIEKEKIQLPVQDFEKFLLQEKEKGFNENDLEITVTTSTHGSWETYTMFFLKNKFSGASRNTDKVIFFTKRDELSKIELLELDSLLEVPVKINREKILGNKEAALNFNFLQNNLNQMQVDQETHNFILACRNEKEKNETIEKEAKKQAIKEWALQNGSELVKLRIEENMNWLSLADDEYFKSLLPESFEFLIPAPDSDWEIQNATVEQIKQLREVRAITNNSAKLMRYKYVSDDEDSYEREITHVDLIQVGFESISGTKKVFEKELSRETKTTE